jgi:hypothetical protein
LRLLLRRGYSAEVAYAVVRGQAGAAAELED